jgi:hypothetical protein
MDLLTFFIWMAKIIMAFAGVMICICLWVAFKLVLNAWSLFWYQWNLSKKWNHFKSLSPEAQEEALKNKDFFLPDEQLKPTKKDKTEG